MELTVVIPVYNRAKIVARTLKSLECQTTHDFSVILIDNNSTDNTLRVLEQWRDKVAPSLFPVTVITEKTPGATAARNAGLKLVETPYTMFFDSDDEMLPTHISDFIAAIKSNPDVELFGRPAVSLKANGQKQLIRFTTSSMMYNHIFHSILSTQRYIAKTELFRRVGGWNESLPAWNDYELGIRILLARPKAAQVSGKPTVIQYMHDESITGADYFHNRLSIVKVLDLIEEHLRKAGETSAISWVNVRRIIMAARFTIEGHLAAGKELRDRTLANSATPLRLRMLYLQHRIMGRGTAIPAKILFP